MISQTLMVKEIDSHLLKFQSPFIHVICDMDKIAFVILSCQCDIQGVLSKPTDLKVPS